MCAAWKDTLAEPQALRIFFSVYLNTTPPVSGPAVTCPSNDLLLAEYALGCLVHLASVRRTLFSNQQVGI